MWIATTWLQLATKAPLYLSGFCPIDLKKENKVRPASHAKLIVVKSHQLTIQQLGITKVEFEQTPEMGNTVDIN